jgi:hypothetical protein
VLYFWKNAAEGNRFSPYAFESFLRIQNNRGKNRGVFEFGRKMAEFCPKTENSTFERRIIGEFCGYLRNAAATKNLLPLFGGFRKRAGKEQILPPVENTPRRRHFHRQTTIKLTPPRKP